jgi:histidinol phosphatase-like PHP family hydrolase
MLSMHQDDEYWIAQQHRETDRLNKRYGNVFRIFKGIESDILADGSLDYPDEVLASFDFVVASIHGRFKLDRKAQTQRLLRPISDPHTTIIGHMTGRQLQRRPGYEIDVEKVLRACAKHRRSKDAAELPQPLNSPPHGKESRPVDVDGVDLLNLDKRDRP